MYLKTGLSVILLLFIFSLFGEEKKSSGNDLPHSMQNAYASVAERAMPAVVTIIQRKQKELKLKIKIGKPK